jgi:predicted transcriptional regulator
MDRKIMEENIPALDVEQIIELYNAKLQEQTAIIFALVGKFGGKVSLTKEDLVAFPEFNTIDAKDGEDGALFLELIESKE